MSVKNNHIEYTAYTRVWRRCRDVIAGRDALLVQARTYQSNNLLPLTSFTFESYIPRLEGQSPQEYLEYCERASFFNATGRTVDAFAGLVFAKPATIEVDPAIESFLNDINLSGDSLREFTQHVVYEELSTTRCGILVDYPAVDNSGMTRAEAEMLNIRPFMQLYKAESIINWKTANVNGAQVVTMVVLTEQREQQKDEFSSTSVTVYRVLDLFEGAYRVRVLDGKGNPIEPIRFPTMNGQLMRFIPFTFIGGVDIRKPLLIDLIDTNLAHYRNSADYEHGLHFTGLPTPYVAGVTLGDGQSLTIGSKTAWVFSDPSANAGYLEFKGDGLKTLAEALKQKEQRMAVLGARMLADEKRSSETSSTVELRTAGERSILAATAYDVSDAIRKSLNYMSMWVGSGSDNKFVLNVDFGVHRMDYQMINSLVSAVQSDMMPMRVFFDNLQRGEIVSPDITYEEYENDLNILPNGLELQQ